MNGSLNGRPSPTPGRIRTGSLLAGFLLLFGLLMLKARAEIQLDVFAGYEGAARMGHWFPVAVEVFNDGGAFDATIELGFGGATSDRQVLRESLPTGTRKRFLLSAYASSANASGVHVRVADSLGKTLAERTQNLAFVPAEGAVLGAIPATSSGLPSMPGASSEAWDGSIRIARMDPAYFPENPLALEGLGGLYLHSDRLASFRPAQVDALLAWVHNGGHLVLALEQVTGADSAPALKSLLPIQPRNSGAIVVGPALLEWIRSAPARPSHGFESPSPRLRSRKGKDEDQPPRSGRLFQTAPGDGLDRGLESSTVLGPLAPNARPMISAGGTTIASTRAVGWGRVTLLGWNPEREPLRGAAAGGHFWAALFGVPPQLLTSEASLTWAEPMFDDVMSALVETEQVRKLPIVSLLALLVVYLVVIGPFDRWLVRRLRKPMLTWVTFPAYVVAFSLMLYAIGFHLRAGKTEWNEIHLADLHPLGTNGAVVGVRGRTYGSVYSPSNERYALSLDRDSAGFRRPFGEMDLVGGNSGLLSRGKAEGMDAELFVPIWTSRTAAAEWAGTATAPFEAALSADGANVSFRNTGPDRITAIWVVESGLVHGPIRDLPPGGTAALNRRSGGGVSRMGFLEEHLPRFRSVLNHRRSMFGRSDDPPRLTDRGATVVAASILGTDVPPPEEAGEREEDRGYRSRGATGQDMSSLLRDEGLLVFALVEDHRPSGPLNRFEVSRHRTTTVFRMLLRPLNPSRP